MATASVEHTNNHYPCSTMQVAMLNPTEKLYIIRVCIAVLIFLLCVKYEKHQKAAEHAYETSPPNAFHRMALPFAVLLVTCISAISCLVFLCFGGWKFVLYLLHNEQEAIIYPSSALSCLCIYSLWYSFTHHNRHAKFMFKANIASLVLLFAATVIVSVLYYT